MVSFEVDSSLVNVSHSVLIRFHVFFCFFSFSAFSFPFVFGRVWRANLLVFFFFCLSCKIVSQILLLMCSCQFPCISTCWHFFLEVITSDCVITGQSLRTGDLHRCPTSDYKHLSHRWGRHLDQWIHSPHHTWKVCKAYLMQTSESVLPITPEWKVCKVWVTQTSDPVLPIWPERFVRLCNAHIVSEVKLEETTEVPAP